MAGEGLATITTPGVGHGLYWADGDFGSDAQGALTGSVTVTYENSSPLVNRPA